MDCMTNLESFICIVLFIVSFSVLAIGYRRKRRYGRFDIECETALIVLVFMGLCVLPWVRWGRWMPPQSWAWWVANSLLTTLCLMAVACFVSVLGFPQILPRRLRISLMFATSSLCLLSIGQWSGWHTIIQSTLVGPVIGCAFEFWKPYAGSLLWMAVRVGLKDAAQVLYPWSQVGRPKRVVRSATSPSERSGSLTQEAGQVTTPQRRQGVARRNVKLSPTQEKELERLVGLIPCGNIFVLYAGTGLGKSTMLAELHRLLGGTTLSMLDVLDVLRPRHPMSLEETFGQLLLESLAQSDIVLVDDLHLIEGVVGCQRHFYPRCGMLDVVLNAVCTYAIEANKKLIFASTHGASGPVSQRCYYIGFEQFEIPDYAFLCAAHLGEATALRLDIEKIHRFAPKLNAHQIKSACEIMKPQDGLHTEQFIHHLLEHGLASNVELNQVELVDLEDLKGVDAIVSALETHVILPFENDELSKELDLTPKKGVLLYGPPGTGKTTIGRALAHRLRGKFFLIDGTFIAGTEDFYGRVNAIFESAKQNAPSVIFIDDSDVIWESQEEMGLYRYLLTQLDGLENEAPGMVCVMMTAMDVGKLPPALVRSGRMELWLELPLPNEPARQEILEHWIATLPEPLRDVEVARVLAQTEGFTGADLRRLTADAKNIYAWDRARRQPLLSPTDYLLRAVEGVRENQRKRAEAEAKIQSQHQTGPRFPSTVFPLPNIEGDEEPPSE